GAFFIATKTTATHRGTAVIYLPITPFPNCWHPPIAVCNRKIVPILPVANRTRKRRMVKASLQSLHPKQSFTIHLLLSAHPPEAGRLVHLRKIRAISLAPAFPKAFARN